jgi:hypothetical protein
MKNLTVMIIALLIASCCAHIITPVEMTKTAIMETFVRMNMFAKNNKTIPKSLNILPKRKGYANRITDGWNRPLIYSISQDDILTLTSLGKDGLPGGVGENADIVKSYYAKRKDGSLWIGASMWLVNAEITKKIQSDKLPSQI